jgi:hypothetical protein
VAGGGAYQEGSGSGARAGGGEKGKPVDLRQHGMSCEVEEHGGASAHPLDHLVEDGKQRNSLTLVSSRSGNYGGWSTMAV